MEKNLDKCMDELKDEDGVTGCLISDKQGLCLGAKGDASNESAGIITAIADLVSHLEPSNPSPIILLENDNRQCLIQRSENITCAIYKKTTVS